jgi:hypothetical protein
VFLSDQSVVGMRDVLRGLLLVRTLIMAEFIMRFRGLVRFRGDGSLDHGGNRRLESGRFGLRCRDRLMMLDVVVLAAMVMVVVISVVVVTMPVIIMRVRIVIVIMRLVAMIVVVMVRIEPGLGMRLVIVGIGVLAGRNDVGGLRLDHLALDPLAMPAPAGIAMTGTAPVAAVFGLFLGFPMRPLFGLDQGLTVGDRNLVIVGMDFAEGQEAVAVAAIFDKGGLERGFYPRDLGEIDITAQLLALGGLEIKFFDAIAADHDDPGLFRVGGIDQHLVGHFGTLGGGGRVEPRALDALSADATVHLIRG